MGGNANGGGWTAVPNAVLTDTRLTPTERLLYVLLLSYDWQDGNGDRKGFCWPSQATLAELLGCTPRTVQAALARLEAVGLIRVDHRAGGPGGGSSNRYTLALCPSDTKSTSCRSPDTKPTSPSDTKYTSPSDTKYTSYETYEYRNKQSEAENDDDPLSDDLIVKTPGPESEAPEWTPSVKEFWQVLRPQVAPSTFAAYLSGMTATADGATLVLSGVHGMALDRLMGRIERAAKQAGFAAVQVSEG